VGGLAKHKTDLRLVCASNADLGACVREGRFRKDLYYRLEAIRIHVPPLRDRPEDILPLAKRFLRAISEDKGKSFRDISSEAAGVLLAHSWPGNVRQLRNAMERVVIMWDETELRPEHLAFLGSQAAGKRGEGKKSPAGEIDEALPAEGLDLQELNQRIIRRALALHGGNITKTAQYLGMSRRSLSYRLKNMSAEN
jgi:DNA-binding NtrC family response regulator